MIADSNLFIYATQPGYLYLIEWIKQTTPLVSPITQVETLGYHRYTDDFKWISGLILVNPVDD